MRRLLLVGVVALAACKFPSPQLDSDATGGSDAGAGSADAAPDGGPGPVTIQWGADPGTFAEGTSATLVAKLNHAATADVQVAIAVTGGSSPASRYSLSASMLTIAKGQTMGAVPLTIIDDGVSETASTDVVVTMSSPTGAPDDHVELGTKVAITTSIGPDNAPKLTFAAASADASEGTTAHVVVQLDQASPVDVTVDVTTAGTATADTDFTLGRHPVTIAAGATTATLDVVIANDSLYEGDETLVLTLANPTGGAVIGANNIHTLTLDDKDAKPSVAFSTSAQSAAEGVGSVTLTVNLSAASGLDTTVAFAADGTSTATATADYTFATTSPLTIAAGATSATIRITVVQDVTDEDNETVVVKLSAPTNATLGTPATDTVTITDDDLACYGTGAFALCVTRAPQTALTIPATNQNSDTSTFCATTQPTWPNQAGAPAVCLVAGSTLSLSGLEGWTGSRPVVYLADTTMTLAAGGAIAVNSAHGGITGAGAGTSGNCNLVIPGGDSSSGGGGGGGGSFLTKGGNGGNGNGGIVSGGLAAANMAAPTTLRGGCFGGGGGFNGSFASGVSGSGGGAVYLVAKTSITLNGDVNASGGGAAHGGQRTGGSGGGAGGMIVLDAATITLGSNAHVFANGGGGASGGNANNSFDGADPTFTTALGGNGGSTAPGGNGECGGSPSGSPGLNGAGANGGGGGGGGGGYIKSSADLGVQASAGLIDD